MSVATNVIQNMIDNALMRTHTAFCAKVLSVSGDMAKIQPLNMVKVAGGNAQKQAVITDVPILKPSYKNKVTYNNSVCQVSTECDIKVGDTVFCLCAERDITETRKGNFSVPAKGKHMINDAVIIGKF